MTLQEIEIILNRYKSLYESALNDNAEVSQANFIEVYGALDLLLVQDTFVFECFDCQIYIDHKETCKKYFQEK